MERAGYDYILNDNTGEMLSVRRSTGEVTRAIQCVIPEGSLVYTPEEREENRRHKEEREKKFLARCNNLPLGRFYFVPSDERFEGLTPETVTRLIYLNTFADYNNKLMLTERTSIQYKDLPELLGIAKATVSSFWKEISPKYITKTKDKMLFTNGNIFVKGKISTASIKPEYLKFYTEGVSRLYQSTTKYQHKRLGYLFTLLPFINVEYNVLCYNPLEKDIDRIEFITLSEFCRLIEYSVSNMDRLFGVYNSVSFEVNGRKERFCSVVYDGTDQQNGKVFINPHILYSGSDYKKVEILGAFCRA